MTDALIIADEEARAPARDLAKRRGTSVAEVVLSALRTASHEEIRARPETQARPAPQRILTPEEMNPEQRALRAPSRSDQACQRIEEARRHLRPQRSL